MYVCMDLTFEESMNLTCEVTRKGCNYEALEGFVVVTCKGA